MSSASAERLRSLDIFRGAAIAAMVVVNNPGSREETYAPLLHAMWNGWTFADTVFPFFLWTVGIALTLSTARRAQLGADRAHLLRHAARRAGLLFCLGVFVDNIILPVRAFPFFAFTDHLQLTGVLEKIAICYLAAFLITTWTGWRGVVLWIVGLNLIYLGLLFYYPVPGCGAGVLTTECNFVRYLDGTVLQGHLWRDPTLQDPDGLGSILPAISTVLFGVLTGHLLRGEPRPGQRTLRLLGLGLVLTVASALLATFIPVNKPLWTTSYAFLMAGLASICFATWYWLVDIRKLGRWFMPLQIYGMNAIAAYVVSTLGEGVPKVHVFGKTLYADVWAQLVDPPYASFLYAVTYALGVFVVVWYLYRRRLFLKF
jgi:predicted acyltransferase